MANTFNPDFSKMSNWNPESGVSMVRFGADAPITEMELNEMQLIQNDRRRELVKYLITNGLSKEGTISFTSGTLTIQNKHAFVDGYHVFIDSASVSVANGQTVYLNVFEQTTVGPSDTLKKYGNVNGTTITNYIMDSRYNQEISKRVVVAYELSTTQKTGAKTLVIGTVNSSGAMTYNYTDSGILGTSEMDTKEYLYENAKEITLTPAELKAKREAGDFSGLEIGDYVTIPLIGEFAGKILHFDIAGINIYNGYSTDNENSIDFVVREILRKSRINAINSNVGGFVASELYTYLQTNIWNSLPQEWKDVISPKKVLLENKAAAESTTWEWKSMNLWLLADIELFGYQSWSQRGYGSGNFKQYPLFRSERHLIKKLIDGTPWWYWLIQPSTYGDGTTIWCHCNYYGGSYSSIAGDADGGVVFGFRI